MRFSALIAATFLFACSPALAQCNPRAVIPLERLVSGHFALTLALNGTPKRFLIDTGASSSLVTSSTASALGLPSTPLAHSAKALSGDAITEQVHLKSISLGGLDQGEGDFAILPNASPLMDGIIGIDILARYDVEFDFAQSHIVLFAPGQCTPDWTASAHVIAYNVEQFHMAIPVILDGKPLTAWLDTGAQQTLISQETAEALYSLHTTRIQPAKPPRQKYRFEMLTVAGIDHPSPQLVLAPDATLNFRSQARLLLGIDILRRHKLFFAFGKNTVTVAP